MQIEDFLFSDAVTTNAEVGGQVFFAIIPPFKILKSGSLNFQILGKQERFNGDLSPLLKLLSQSRRHCNKRI